MVVDVKKLIAAINPTVYCSRQYDRGTRLYKKVERIAKEEGYLKAAEKAELIDSDFMDIDYVTTYINPYTLPGFKAPIEAHELEYDDFFMNLEPVYFWILDYVNNGQSYKKSEKIVDNFVSSVGSGHFAEMSSRATIMRDQATKYFGMASTVVRGIMNIIYDLKQYKMVLAPYDDLRSEKKSLRDAAKLSLKQRWMDNVDMKRGRGSINQLANELDFVTIRDAFLVADDVKDIKKLDLNDRVKRILYQRVSEFDVWLRESERELKKRFEIEKIYLKSQVNTLKLYSRWLKPYLRAASQLEQRAEESAALVSAFNITTFELVLLAIGKYDIDEEIGKGNLPNKFSRLAEKTGGVRIREYYPVAIIEFSFRSIPEKYEDKGGYGFRGKVKMNFTSFALNDEELDLLKEKVREDDFGDVYKAIEGATEESLDQINEDIDEFLGASDEPQKRSGDSNPFTALFSFFKKDDDKKNEKDYSKGIVKDNEYEKVVRSGAILKARKECRKLYERYKKARGLVAF